MQSQRQNLGFAKANKNAFKLDYGVSDTLWIGALRRTDDGIRGTLSDKRGWCLLLTAIPDAGNLAVMASVSAIGSALPPWSDDGLRVALEENLATVLTGVWLRSSSTYVGTLRHSGDGQIEINATVTEPGVMTLRGVG